MLRPEFYLVVAQEMKIFVQVAPARDISGAKFTEHFVFPSVTVTVTVTGDGESDVRDVDVCLSLSDLTSPHLTSSLSLVIFTWQLTD